MTTHNIDYVRPHHTQNSFRYLRCWGGLSEAPVFASFSRMNEPWPWWWRDDMMTWLLINKLRLVIFLFSFTSRFKQGNTVFIVWRRTHRQFFLSPIMAFWGAMGPHSASYSFILRHRKLKLYEALWGPMAPQRAVMGEKKNWRCVFLRGAPNNAADELFHKRGYELLQQHETTQCVIM